MGKFTLLLLTLLISGVITAQNLVPNPSFELNSGCPGGIAAINNWYIIGNHSGSPDAFHTCSPGTFGVPGNVFGNQLPRTGNCYIGFVTYFISPGFREYCQIQLTSPLVAGQTYLAEMYVSLSDGSGYGTDGYQFYFSNTAVLGLGTNQALTIYTPQVANPIGNFITDQVGWVRVFGSFVAAGGEQYLTIGNFKNDAATNYAVVPGWNWNYSYIDDVSVTPAVVLPAAVNLQAQWQGNSNVGLAWETTENEALYNYEIERSFSNTNDFRKTDLLKSDIAIESEAKFTAKDFGADPQTTNFYRLRIIDGDGSVQFSNVVEVPPLSAQNHFVGLYPNPGNGNLSRILEMNLVEDSRVKVDVFDLNGKKVWSHEFVGEKNLNRFQIPTEGMNRGYYLLRYSAGTLVGSEKLIVD